MATCRIGKALLTSLEFSQGVLNAIDSVLEQVPASPAQAYRQTSIMSHGTTVTRNTLIQRSGAKRGLFITKRFDTLLIGRVLARVVGLSEGELDQLPEGRKAWVRDSRCRRWAA